MLCIPKDTLLEHHPDTVEVIRTEFNLNGPGMMEDAIRILKEWVLKQPHFKVKEFSDEYLEIVLYDCKGSLERAKKQIDRFCTVRTLMPQFFEVRNPKTDYGPLFEVFTPAVLPKLTPDHYRVFMIKGNDKSNILKDYLDYFAYDVMICDYLKIHDRCRGYMAILDFMELNIMDFLSNVSPVMLRQVFSICIEGYGMRIKGIHIYTPSKLVDGFVTLLKQVSNPKIADRIHSHKKLDNLQDVVPVEILPAEYGGKEKSLKALSEQWLDVLSSEENLNYLRELNKAGTDEACRQTDKFNEEYAGMPGTFRVLSVD